MNATKITYVYEWRYPKINKNIYGFLIIKNNNHVALELYLSIKFESCTAKLKTNK